jgi:peptidyl-dipeptidase Dcp
MARHLEELQAIAEQAGEPTFHNTLVALESSGTWLETVANVFFNLTSAHTSEAIQKVEAAAMPKMARHNSAIYLNAKLFSRIEALHRAKAALQLSSEELRLLDRWHLDFVREGAKLEGSERKRFEEISVALAETCTQFSQTVVKDMAATTFMVTREADLKGLPEDFVSRARKLAVERGQPDAWVFALNEPTVMEFVAAAENRTLRERFWNLWKHRGGRDGGHDTRPLVSKILQLRQEQAHLLGFQNYADYALANTMASKPQAARDLLDRTWKPARLRALQDREELATLARELGHGDINIEEWDWDFYAEKVRQKKFQLDESELRPYLPLNGMIEAVFETATRLFDVRFREIKDAPRYHPDVRTWELTDSNGKQIGIFMGDYYARASKRSGAWMSNYREQRALPNGECTPIVVNVCNFTAPGSTSEPALIAIDELRTLFHEFGHALHGLLSATRFPRLSGTNVLRDFVEFPSQLLEHWALNPELLKKHARHVKSGEAIPDRLIEKLKQAGKFNQAYTTVEYVASALIDLDLHEHSNPGSIQPDAYEADFLKRVELPRGIKLRHRLPHFLHVFSGPGYASLYYVYLWAGVLDSDGYGAFEEAGDAFAPEAARKLKEFVYTAGNSREPMEAYIAFRGRAPAVEPLLKKRGLL